MRKKVFFTLTLGIILIVFLTFKVSDNQSFINYAGINIKNVDNKWKVLEEIVPEENPVTGMSGSLHLINETDSVEISLLLRSKEPVENPQGYERPRIDKDFQLQKLDFLTGASFTCGPANSSGTICYVVEDRLTDNGISTSYRYWLGEVLGFKSSTILISEPGKDSKLSEQGKAAGLKMLEQIISI